VWQRRGRAEHLPRPFATAGAARRETEGDWARLPAAPEPARPPAPPRSWAAGVAAATGVSADAPRWGEAALAYAPAAPAALLAAAAPAAAAAAVPVGPEGEPAAAAAGPARADAAHDAAGPADGAPAARDGARGAAAPTPLRAPDSGGAGAGQPPGRRRDRAPPAVQGVRQPLGRAGDEGPQGGGEPRAPEPASATAGGLHGTSTASARASLAGQPPAAGAAGAGGPAVPSAGSGPGAPAAPAAAAAGPEPPPCAICDEPLGGDVALFPCGHFFCEACARRHLARQAACPACRARAKPASVFRCRHRRQAAPPRGEDPALAHVRAPASLVLFPFWTQVQWHQRPTCVTKVSVHISGDREMRVCGQCTAVCCCAASVQDLAAREQRH